jgi:Polymerase beta, Nucleotidyltransferase
MEVTEISLEFVMTLRPSNDVNAVVLFGSHASNQARADSDVDLLVIVQKGFEQISQCYRDRLFEITFVTEKSTLNWWRANPDHCVMLWRNAKVIYSDSDTEKRLKQFAAMIEKRGKLELPVAEVGKRHRAAKYQLLSLNALADHDPLAANLVLGEKMAEYVSDYFAVRGSWLPAPKARLAVIRSRDHRTGVLLDEFADPCMNLSRKFAVADKLVDAIFQHTEVR